MATHVLHAALFAGYTHNCVAFTFLSFLSFPSTLPPFFLLVSYLTSEKKEANKLQAEHHPNRALQCGSRPVIAEHSIACSAAAMPEEHDYWEWNDTTKSLVSLSAHTFQPHLCIQAVAVGIMAFIWLPNLFFSWFARNSKVPSRAERDRKRRFKMA